MINDLLRRRHMPASQRPLRTVSHGSREYVLGPDGKISVGVCRLIFPGRGGERDGERSLHCCLCVSRQRGREEEQRAEHVFVSLSTEREFVLAGIA